VLSTQQIDQFHRDGLLVIRGVFGGTELKGLQDAATEVQEEAVAGRGSGHGYRDVDGRRQYYRTDGGLWEGYAAFRAATVHPGLLAAVGQCVGHPFMPLNDSLVVKMPHSGVSIPWHQDPPYQGSSGRRETFGIPNFDCDIYLDAATEQNGCLCGLAGHHLAGHVEVERFEEEALYDREDVVALEMAPGDVLLHAITAPHGSKANDSDSLRRVFYVHYMAREVLETLHPEMATTDRGFTPDAVQIVQAMVDERARSGLVPRDMADIDLTRDGIVFTGEPTTPRWHWQTLVANQAPERILAAKTLATDAAGVEVGVRG
jgi:phytanoyl-CoA hydroxylase